ncbi:MAG: hypothetical protein SGBAC_001134 [Bacillariaceae sp.]
MQNQQQGKLKVVAGYALEKRLGSGSFATVYKGVRVPASAVSAALVASSNNEEGGVHPESHPDVVAIKAISRTSTKLTKKVLQNLEVEISILRTYQHPNIVCMHEAHKTEKHFFLILEYCGGGDVQGLIRSRKPGRLTERLTRRLMRDLASGLRFLWSQELIHRDIKPMNLLLTGALPLDENDDPEKTKEGEARRRQINFPSDQFRLKIADFGFARHLQTASLAETLCGSPLYMAPEILQHHRYDAKADLWSVGTVLFEMIAGHPPFNGENHIDLLKNIQTKPVRLPPNVQISNTCVKLLRLLLNRNPLSRAGFKEFFECCDDFVALGCGGFENQSGGTRRDVTKDLGTIQEDDGTAHIACSESLLTVATNQEQTMEVTSIQNEHINRMIASPSSPSQVVNPAIVNSADTITANHAPIPNNAKKLPPLTQSPPTPSHMVPHSNNNVFVPPVDQPRQPWTQNQQEADVSEKYDMSRSDDSGFVMVEIGADSRKDMIEPSGVSMNLIGQRGHVPPHQPSPMYYLNSQSSLGKAVSSRIGMGERKSSKGMLSTSPGTGGFLMGLYGRQRIGYDQTTKDDPKLGDQIATASKMIAASEDVGRRAVSVAHLGDSRAYLGICANNSNDDDDSSIHTTAPMEAEDGTGNTSEESAFGEVMTVSRRRSSLSTDKIMAITEEEEMPFAISPDAPTVSLPSRSNHSTHSKESSMVSVRKGGGRSESWSVRLRLGEALSCYLKALKMLKSAVGATQRVSNDLEALSSQSGQSPTEYDIPKLRKHCEVTSTWLRGQFCGVLERAESANSEISKMQWNIGDKQPPAIATSVEELIYTHALASGRDGAVKQLLGQNEAARTCYRSAGLLVETLLMEAGIGTDDRRILEGYVDAFASRINELDKAMLNQPHMLGSSPTNTAQRDSGIVGLIGPPTSVPTGFAASPSPH